MFTPTTQCHIESKNMLSTSSQQSHTELVRQISVHVLGIRTSIDHFRNVFKYFRARVDLVNAEIRVGNILVDLMVMCTSLQSQHTLELVLYDNDGGKDFCYAYLVLDLYFPARWISSGGDIDDSRIKACSAAREAHRMGSLT